MVNYNVKTRGGAKRYNDRMDEIMENWRENEKKRKKEEDHALTAEDYGLGDI